MSGRSSTVDTLSIYDRNRGLSTDPPGPTSSPLKRTGHHKTWEEVFQAEGWPAIQSNVLSKIRFDFRARGFVIASYGRKCPRLIDKKMREKKHGLQNHDETDQALLYPHDALDSSICHSDCWRSVLEMSRKIKPGAK